MQPREKAEGRERDGRRRRKKVNFPSSLPRPLEVKGVDMKLGLLKKVWGAEGKKGIKRLFYVAKKESYIMLAEGKRETCSKILFWQVD